MDIEKKIQETFPGAVSIKEFFDEIDEEVRNLGFTSNHVLAGLCICRDDNGREIRKECLQRYKAGFFSLESLAGIPSFPGVTAYKAMAHHVPEDGLAVHLIFPHIGLSQEGVYGMVERVGQTKPSPNCGAVVACVKAITEEKDVRAENDFEFYRIWKFLKSCKLQGDDFSSLILDATERVYDFSISEYEKVFKEIKSEYHSPVLRISGIIINTANQDYIQKRDLKVFNPE